MKNVSNSTSKAKRFMAKAGLGVTAFVSSAIVVAQEAPRKITDIGSNLLGEASVGLNLLQSGGAILGAGMIVAALISWFMRSKKGAQASQDTLWWPAAMGIGILLIYSTMFTDAVGTSVMGQGEAESALESFEDDL